jgi:hypothetical protein
VDGVAASVLQASDASGRRSASTAGSGVSAGAEPDPWGLNPAPHPPKVAKKASPKPKEAPPPDPGHQRCVDAYHDAFLACTGQRPIVGGAEGAAMKTLREKFRKMDTRRTSDERDAAVISFLRNFYANDWRGPTTSLRQIATDPTRYLVPQKRFSRPEIGASLQRGDDNMPTRFMTDEDFKR